MKKNRVMAILMMSVTILAGTTMLAGCGGNTSGNVTDTEQSELGEAETVHTVTFYDSDGSTVLSTEEVADGTCAKEYTPEKDGYIFVGWFATPQMSHRFDYTMEITDDTSVFAGFVSYVEDEREFAIVGSGTSPVLLESNWGKVIGDAQKMTKEENDEANIYTITVDLNAGDEFQFAINTEWNHQRGYGYLQTLSQDGVEYFKNSGGLGETSTKRSNIKCAVSGNYTFTLTTYPGEDVYETDNPNYKELPV